METPKKEKAKYEQPVLKRIDLMAEEVLSSGCKTNLSGGPNQSAQCTAGCSAAGS